MPAATFYQPVEKIIDGKCEYSYYSAANGTYSKDAKSRICHITLPNANELNANVLMLIFTIRNQNGKWKIHSEGAQRMDQGAMVPTRNTALKLAKDKRWKFIAIATAGKDAPEDDIVTDYFISIESYSYGDDTVCEITDELSKLEELGKPDFYRTYIKLNGAIYSLAFIKRDKLIDYLYKFDDRPYGNIQSLDDLVSWHKETPTDEEYARFKQLMSFFVRQVKINNEWTSGEKKFVNSGQPNAAAFIEPWRHYNGFDLKCRFGSGYQTRQAGSNYINYSWVNINPEIDTENKVIKSLTVRTKPNKVSVFTGTSFDLAALDLDSDSAPNDALKNLFQEFRDEIYKWQKGEYSNDNGQYSQIFDYKTGIQTNYAYNRIIFGAPGTGKSFKLDQDKNEITALGGEYERVTFHSAYSYANFVGTYKPVPSVDSEGNEIITYSYVPGPFMRVLTKALKSALTDSPKPYLLIVEEINRAEPAAVFGEVFQLLDRVDGVSEYSIELSEDQKKYIKGETGLDLTSVKIPDNMYIWATMNSADQGVFPIDTAFKRRWSFEYIGIDNNEKELPDGEYSVGSNKISWKKLRKAINKRLTELKINEDKLLGPFFLSKEVLNDEGFESALASKVLMYLYEDAAKMKRGEVFAGTKRYSEIREDFVTKGVDIFHSAIAAEYNK